MDVRLICASYEEFLLEKNIIETDKPPPVCNHLLFIESVEGLMYISQEFQHFLENIGYKPEMKWSAEGMPVANIYNNKLLTDIVIENYEKLNNLSGLNVYLHGLHENDVNNFPYNAYTIYAFKKPSLEYKVSD